MTNLARIISRANLGIEAPEVIIEIHLSPGLPALSIVGLPEAAVKESKERVRSALINSGFSFPTRRITVNLAPADLPKKDGGRFDLPIALGILAASKQLSFQNFDQYEFAGELSLDGSLRSIGGILPFAIATKKSKRTLILPKKNAKEASLAIKIDILAADHLLEICAHFSGSPKLNPYVEETVKTTLTIEEELDLSDIYGQVQAKRALEIIAAGGHNLLMIGPPGVGKTMLAQRLTTILPPLSEEQKLETAVVYSLSEHSFELEHKHPPFRAPHHTISTAALVGGSSPPRPGEISLAHNGVLFLDELLEFNRKAIEALREPLEAKSITISRASYRMRFPANFQLVVAMNPCPCGYYGARGSQCNCTGEQIKRYRSRISGPFLDRLDFLLTIPALPKEIWFSKKIKGESSQEIRLRVVKAREVALLRQGKINSALNNRELEQVCGLSSKEKEFFEEVIEKLSLSGRASQRILRVARTIADLADRKNIELGHLKEALGYRQV